LKGGLMAENHETLIKRDMSYSIKDGLFSNVMTTIFTGVYLTGFALELGVSQYLIGLLASLPAIANLGQIFGPVFINRVGGEKKACLISAGLYRLFWLLIAAIPLYLYFDLKREFVIAIFFFLLLLASLAAAFSNVSWMGWISLIIPANLRGNFFGRRNMYAGFSAMAAGLLAGFWIDFWHSSYPGLPLTGYSILFIITLFSGIISWFLMVKISAGVETEEADPSTLFENLKIPLQDKNFRLLIIFSMAWAFAVGLASPFFSVYMINTLELPFTLISLFGLAAAATNIIGMKYWGQFVDRIGSKSLLYFSSMGAGLLPIIWIFTSADSYNLLWVINLLTGVFWSGIGLATSLLLMQLARERYRIAYYGLFAAGTGLAAAIAPIIGGVIAGLTADLSLTVNFIELEGLHFLFILAVILRVFSLGLLARVEIERQMTIQEILDRSRAVFHPFRSVQQVAGLGFQSLENVNLTVSKGLFQWESQLDIVFRKGRYIWYRAGKKANRFERQLESIIDKAEETQGTLINKIFKLIDWLNRVGEEEE
ncbi:MAG: MFS transporter, partial [Bacillota bacterium]